MYTHIYLLLLLLLLYYVYIHIDYSAVCFISYMNKSCCCIYSTTLLKHQCLHLLNDQLTYFYVRVKI